MKTIVIESDIKVLCVTARSFPDGVMEAHQKLHSIIPYSKDRRYFGISRPEHGLIIYKAAAEEINPGESEQLINESVVLKKGNYACITIHDFMKDLKSIGIAFQELLKISGLDPNGYCVEWYLDNKDVRCMIRLDD